MVLPTTAGMHRVAWDLRYPDPPTLNYGYSGTLLDYREYTLELARAAGTDAADDARRADGAAGHVHREADRQRPQLHAADHRRRRIRASRVRPRRSPRSSGCSSGWSPASRRRTTRVQLRQELRAALTARATESPANGAAAQIAQRRADARRRAGAAHQRTGGFRHRASRSWTAAQRSARRRHGADGERDRRRRRPVPRIDTALDTLRRLQTSTIAELNASLQRAGLGPLPAWTPPPAPACGAGR